MEAETLECKNEVLELIELVRVGYHCDETRKFLEDLKAYVKEWK